MAIRGIFKFYGDGKDEYRMPKPYHVYMVYSSPHPSLGMERYSIVSILVSLHNTPLPDIKEYAIEKDVESAINEVFNIIANMPENKGLRSIKSLEKVNDSGRG